MATLSLLYGGKILESRERWPKILLKLALVTAKIPFAPVYLRLNGE
jgi:hypothetical protein